jgi:hypothetical protein
MDDRKGTIGSIVFLKTVTELVAGFFIRKDDCGGMSDC